MDRRQLLIGGAMFLAGCLRSDEPSGEEDETFLRILDHEASDEWVVEGRAQNVSDQMLESAMVRAKFTGETGDILDTDLDSVSNLTPGEQWEFTMAGGGSFHDLIRGYYFDTAAVPE
jgi:hypothetical protein